MAKMKEYAQERGYLGCCNGIDLCMDCQYHVETSKYYGKWKPTLETWYNRICKKVVRIKQKTTKTKIPF